VRKIDDILMPKQLIFIYFYFVCYLNGPYVFIHWFKRNLHNLNQLKNNNSNTGEKIQIYIIHNSNLVGPTIYLNSQKLEFFDR